MPTLDIDLNLNIKIQCCGIVLILLIAILYERRGKLNLITDKMFRASMYASLACLVLDVLSLVAIYYWSPLTSAHFPEFWAKVICKSYLVSLVLVGLLAQFYISSAVYMHVKYYKKIIIANVVFGIILAVLIYALPIKMVAKSAGEMWTEGPSDYVTYGGMLVIILTTLSQILLHRKTINVRQRRTVIIWMGLWLIAAVIQFFINELLIVGFSGALGVALVFFQFENPELNYDRNTGLYNYSAFSRYGEQMYGRSRKFYVIGVLLENTLWQGNKNAEVGAYTQDKNYDAFLTIPGATVFKIMENEILLIFSKDDQANAAWERLKGKGFHSLYYVEDPRCVSTHTELLDLLHYYSFLKKDGMPGSFYFIGRSVVEQMLAEYGMVQQIVDALEEDRVVVYYQPIYSVEQKRFTSAEALVRIIDKDGKLIPPGAFINIAERNGMIVQIGKRVFQKVCRFFKQNKLEEYGMEYVEVNLSVVQCADERLAADYIDILKDTEMDPGRINLEITESSSLQTKQTLIENMEKMIEYGIHFSLDDFGTGESNLNYIVDMPVSIVKFDRGMIQSYFSSGKAKYVMDAAMHMIQGMDLEMVAEGIETEEQYKKMEEIKIDYIQGFYFSKPLPEQEFLEFLRIKNAKS